MSADVPIGVGAFPYKGGFYAVYPAVSWAPAAALFAHVTFPSDDTATSRSRMNPATDRGPDRDLVLPSQPLWIARRLLAREAAAENGGPPQRFGADLHRACLAVSNVLRESMGDEGTNALLARALARSEGLHPSLKTLRRPDDGGIHLDGVLASVEKYGVAEVTAGIEALLASLLEVLGRLIGEDMAEQIIDSGAARSRSVEGPPA